MLRLLPTPRVSDGNGAGAHGDGGPDLRTAVTLLPTPAVNDMGAGLTVERWDEWTSEMKAKHTNGNGHCPSLSVEARRMAARREECGPGFPTPVADHSRGLAQRGSDFQSLPNAVLSLPPHDVVNLDARSTSFERAVAAARWEKYGPRVARHEAALGRSAPAPTEPTRKDGEPRLSPRLVEWMMGLEDGWVTDVPGLSRPAQLKLLGNGVVPAQAAAAIADCLAALGVVTEP